MLSKIKSIEIRACRGGDELESLDTVAAVKLPGGSRPDFTVVTITTEDGVQGTSFGFGAQDAWKILFRFPPNISRLNLLSRHIFPCFPPNIRALHPHKNKDPKSKP